MEVIRHEISCRHWIREAARERHDLLMRSACNWLIQHMCKEQGAAGLNKRNSIRINDLLHCRSHNQLCPRLGALVERYSWAHTSTRVRQQVETQTGHLKAADTQANMINKSWSASAWRCLHGDIGLPLANQQRTVAAIHSTRHRDWSQMNDNTGHYRRTLLKPQPLRLPVFSSLLAGEDRLMFCKAPAGLALSGARFYWSTRSSLSQQWVKQLISRNRWRETLWANITTVIWSRGPGLPLPCSFRSRQRL